MPEKLTMQCAKIGVNCTYCFLRVSQLWQSIPSLVSSSSGCCWCRQSAVFPSQLCMSTARRGNMETIIRSSVLSAQYLLCDQIITGANLPPSPPYTHPPAEHNNTTFIICYVKGQGNMSSGHLCVISIFVLNQISQLWKKCSLYKGILFTATGNTQTKKMGGMGIWNPDVNHVKTFLFQKN